MNCSTCGCSTAIHLSKVKGGWEAERAGLSVFAKTSVSAKEKLINLEVSMKIKVKHVQNKG